MNSVPPTGSIIRYPYLWKWQRERGETEGRKERPVCMALAIERDDGHHLVLFAISTTPPRPEQTALEIPDLEQRRAGLGGWKESWILVSEYNYDIVEQSYYFDVNAECIGQFSKSFLAKVGVAARPFIANTEARVSRL